MAHNPEIPKFVPLKCIPSLATQKYNLYKSCWFSGPSITRRQLRQRYHRDFARYRQAYRPDQEVLDFLLEECMGRFTKLTSESPFRPDRPKQLAAFQDLSNTLASESPLPLTIVCIDFEGEVRQNGKNINEYGIASIDFSHDSDTVVEPSIDVSTYRLANHRGRRSLWDDATRITHEMLPACIRSSFAAVRNASPHNKIMLLTHGIASELGTLHKLGITIYELSVTEVLDTVVLGQRVLQCKSLSLKCLLDKLDTPITPNSLHSAGNDAHYTIQALLGLMQVKTGKSLGRLDALVRPAPPRIRHWKERIPTHESPEDILAACDIGAYSYCVD